MAEFKTEVDQEQGDALAIAERYRDKLVSLEAKHNHEMDELIDEITVVTTIIDATESIYLDAGETRGVIKVIGEMLSRTAQKGAFRPPVDVGEIPF